MSDLPPEPPPVPVVPDPDDDITPPGPASGPYPVWPFGCPRQWQETVIRPVIRSSLEDGVPKQRARFTSLWFEYMLPFRISNIQLSAFWTFYESECVRGTVPFTMTHSITGAVLILRFAGAPDVTSSPEIKGFFDVSLKLEKLHA